VNCCATVLQFGKRGWLALQGKLAGFGKLLGEGAHLAGGRHVGRAEAADANLVEHEADGQCRKDQEGDAQQAQLFCGALAGQEWQGASWPGPDRRIQGSYPR
jgi:hypothetical protein